MFSSWSRYSSRTFSPGRMPLMNSTSMIDSWKAPFVTDASTSMFSPEQFCVSAAALQVFKNWFAFLRSMLPKPSKEVSGRFPNIARLTMWTCDLINNIALE